MANWWQQPYKGGPMVAVPGFPRELRVGDPDGLDVIAYKRTVWRACRWQGPASRFDDSFSQAFSTGAGPNVIDTGLAGVLRQQGWDDDPIVTEKVFNLLRSIRVPEGKPHALEMAMDTTAANLIAEALSAFRPAAPAPSTVRECALAGAASWLGYTETPAGSNRTTFGVWYGMDGQPWCAMACAYWYEVEAGGSPSFARNSRFSYVPYIVSDAALLRNGLSIVSSPIPGDLVCFDWDRDGTFDHVGLFESGTATSFTTIEGNTSPDSGGSQSNGGGVYRRNRSTSEASVVFVRVDEP